MWTILAVAVGPATTDLIINSTAYPGPVRPYIKGLIAGLKAKGHTIGTDYVVDYRQRPAAKLDASAFAGTKRVIFCMSTTVVHAAKTHSSGVPIVGIVSDPVEENFASVTHICGVSANRFQTADVCLQHFLQAVPSLTELQVLHCLNNRPSQHAHDKAKPVADNHQPRIDWQVIPVAATSDIAAGLQKLPKRAAASTATVGIFALPVDVNFGGAADIIAKQNSKQIPAWFPTPDWVAQGAFGGYGASQETCGYAMAERVDYAIANGPSLPDPRWISIDPGAFEWFVSRRVAAALNIPLNGVPASHIR
jgi:ABC-type uncharacterized transport system substrate-binding protein